MTIVVAMVASGLGATARAALDGLMVRRSGATLPWSTTTVNVVGAFLLGLLVGLHGTGRLGDDALAIAGAGFCGGFTTFSTWMVETIELDTGVGHGPAIANLVGMVLAGLVGTAAGSALA
ncbi:fluoride efflux transporter FluC [Salsipaludibacter albus]|uniref:fluoride efflux transporter FluC n=1 Tax=Salsipaludibacter albus TaxID=2849650 RepID=UPI001EE3EB3A|nr:CrcB family protein [Salsipaludibacter albus]MBY5161797.1 CrcB family protein [Salsipaludibacter albus]